MPVTILGARMRMKIGGAKGNGKSMRRRYRDEGVLATSRYY